MRKEMTRAERRLWFDYLASCEHKFYKQRPIGRYIVDFYCAKLKLVIEVDGDSHYENGAEAHDAERTATLNKQGLSVLRFTNDEVIQYFESTVETIEDWIRTAQT